MAVADYTNLQSKILRKEIPAEAVVQNTAGTDLAVYEEQLIERAETSTQAALLISQIVLGKVPVDGAKLTSLTAFAQAQFDAYTAKGVARPELGPYEALGVGFSSTPEFAALSAGNSNGQFITNIYVLAFGVGPGAPQVQHFNNQITYFTNLYTSAGVPAATAALQARGAVLGQIVGEAATQEGSTLDNQAETFMRALVDGTAVFNAPIQDSAPAPAPGPGELPQTLVLTTGIDVLGPTADFPLAQNDTVIGNGQTIQSGDSVDLGAGDGDRANLILEPTTLLQLLSVYKLTLAGVEQVNVTAGNTVSAVIPLQISADNWTGVQEFWLRDSNLFGTAGVVVDDIQENMALGFDDYQGNAVYLYDNGALGAAATVNVIMQDASQVNLVTGTNLAADEIGRLNLTVLGAGNALFLDLNSGNAANNIDNLTQLHLFGDGFITMNEAEFNTLTVLNGSAGGGFNIKIQNSGPTPLFTANLVATGSAFNDVLDFDGGYDANDSFDGGDGSDTLEVNAVSAHFATSANTQRVETLVLDGELTAAVNIDQVLFNSAGFTTVVLENDTTQNSIFGGNNLQLNGFANVVIGDDQEALVEIQGVPSVNIFFVESDDASGTDNNINNLNVGNVANVRIDVDGTGAHSTTIQNLDLDNPIQDTKTLSFTGAGELRINNIDADFAENPIAVVDLSTYTGTFWAFDSFGFGTDFLVGNTDDDVAGDSRITLDGASDAANSKSELVFVNGRADRIEVVNFDINGTVRDVLDLGGLGVSSLAEITITDVGGNAIITSNTGAFGGSIELIGVTGANLSAAATSVFDFDGVVG